MKTTSSLNLNQSIAQTRAASSSANYFSLLRLALPILAMLMLMGGQAMAQTITDIGTTSPTPGAGDISSIVPLSLYVTDKPGGLNYYDNNQPNNPGQTFTATANATLSSVAFEMGPGSGNSFGNPGVFSIYIYSFPSGHGGATAKLLAVYNSPNTFQYTNSHWIVVSNLSVSVTQGNTYGYAVADANGGYCQVYSFPTNVFAPNSICLINSAGGVVGNLGAVTYNATANGYNQNFDLGFSPAYILSATASPNPVSQGTTLSISVNAGSSAGSVTNVTVNASSIGGSATLALALSSTPNVWTNTVTVNAASYPASPVLAVTAMDNAGNLTSGNIFLTVVGATDVWNGAASPDNRFVNGANWASGVPATGAFADFTGSVQTILNMESPYTFSGLMFDSSAGAYNITNSANILTLQAGGYIANNSTATVTISVPLALAGTGSILANTVGGNVVIANTLTGSGALTFGGVGTNVLSSTNTAYTGALTISGGALKIVGSGQLGNAAAIGTGGALGTGGVYGSTIADNGTLIYNGTGIQQLSGIISGSGGLTVNSGTLILGNSGTANSTTGGESFFGPVVVNGGILDLYYNNPAIGGLNLNSSLTINNGGTVNAILSSANTGYNAVNGTLPTTINAGGTLDVSPLLTVFGAGFSGHLPGVLTLNGGTLADHAAYVQQYGGWYMQNQVNVNGGPITSVISDPYFVPAQTGGTVFNITSGGTSQTIPGVDLEVSGSFASPHGNADTGIILSGNGVMRLDGLNTYSSFTTISNGATLILGTNAQLNSVTTATALASITGNSNVLNNSYSAATNSGLVFTANYGANFNINGTFIDYSTNKNPQAQQLGGSITGAGTLLVSGPNVALALSGVSPFTGNTTISNYSTLSMLSGGSIGNSSNIMVYPTGTFDVSQVPGTYTLGAQNLLGSGTNNGSINTVSGSVIYAGTAGGYGTNTFNNNLTLVGGASTYSDLGSSATSGPNDLIKVSGSLVDNGFATINAPNTGNLDQTHDYVLVTAASVSGQVSSSPVWGVTPANYRHFQVVPTSTSINLHYTTQQAPLITATANPQTAAHEQTVVFTAKVTLGDGAVDPNSGVTLDASSLGIGSVSMVYSNNNIYTNSIQIPAPQAPGNYNFVISVTDANNLVGSTLVAVKVVPAIEVWNGNGSDNTWGNALNWTNNTVPQPFDLLVFNGVNKTNVNMENYYTIAGLTFSPNAGMFNITNAFNYYLILQPNGGVTNNSATNVETLSVTMALNGAMTLNAASNNLVLNLPVFDYSTPNSVITTGKTNILNGLNTYSGFTTISSGTLTIGTNADLGDNGGSVGAYAGAITNNGTFNYNSTNNQTLSGQIYGTGTLALNSVTNTILTLLGGTNPAAYTGPTLVNGGELDLSYANNANAGLYRSSRLTINTNSIVKLLINNSLSGNGSTIGSLPVTINAGGVLTGPTSSHIRGILTLNGGTLSDGGGAPSLTFGTWDLDDGVTVPGTNFTSTISSMAVVPSQSGGTIFNVTNGNTASGIDLNVTGTLISGSSYPDTGIIKNGSGTMQLNGTNTYMGNTTINGGTLILADPASLITTNGPANSLVPTNGPYRGNIVINGTFKYLTTASNTYIGVISGTGTFIVGNGLVISNVDTFAGLTLITNGGTLKLATGSLASTNITTGIGSTFDVSSFPTAYTLLGSQKLMGSGTVNGSINTVSGSGIYAGTDGGYGTNTFNGNLTVIPGAICNFDLGTSATGSNDLIVVSGILTNNGSIRISAPSTAVNLDSQDYVLMTASGGISGTVGATPLWNVKPANSANYTVVTVGNTIKLHYSTLTPPLIVSATASPSSVSHGVTAVITATVTPGSGTITSVIVDVSQIAGISSPVSLVLSNNNVYTNSITIPAGTPLLAYSLPVKVTDNTPLSGSALVVLTVKPAIEVWDGNASPNNNWVAGLNWTNLVAPAAGDVIFFAGNNQTTVNMETGYSITGMTFSNNAGAFNIGGAPNVLTLAAGTTITNQQANVETLNVPVTANGAVTLGSAAGGNLVLNQPLTSTVTASSLLTTFGPGTNTLNGLNTFTNATTIGSGTLIIGSAGDLGDTGGSAGAYPGNIVNNGAFIYSSSKNQGITGIISGTGGLTLNAPVGTVLTIGPSLAGGQVTYTYTGPTVINSGELDFNFANQPQSGIYTSSSMVINSNGIVSLLGASAMEGYTAVAANIPVTVNAGALLTAAASATSFSTHLYGILNLNGGTVADPASTMKQYGGWEIDTNVNVNGGPFMSIISDPETVIAQPGGTVFNVTKGSTPSGVDLDITGALVSTAPTPGTALIVKGNGTMQLDGLNYYISPTIISNGATLILGTGGQLNTLVGTNGTLFGTGAADAAPPGVTVYTGIYNTNIFNNGTFISESTLTSPVKQTLAGVISGTGTLRVSGPGAALILSAANTYTGSTLMLNGSTLFLGAGGSINNSSVIGVTNGATFDYSALGSYTVPAGQTLRGTGTVNGGPVIVNGTLSAGDTATVGTLNLNNNSLTLFGTTTVRLNKGGAQTSDEVIGITTAQYGGTLVLSNVGQPLAVNDTFQLFAAGSGSGNFTITGLPGTFSFNPSTGILTVTSVSVVQPTLGNVRLSNGSLIMSGSNGTPNATFRILSTNIVTAPIANWPTVFTGQFDGSGNYSYTNSTLTNATSFFRLVTP